MKLHQRRLHIASAHFSCCQPWPGNNSFSPHTLCLPSPLLSFIFFFVSCLSVHFSVPLQNYKKKKKRKKEMNKKIKSTGFQGTCECSNHVGPFSVISHNKVTERGRCVGRLRAQRERLMERERERERKARGRV